MPSMLPHCNPSTEDCHSDTPRTFLTPYAKTGRAFADKGRRIEKVNRPRPG